MGLLANATTTLKDVDETEEEGEDGEQEEDLQKDRQHSQRGTCRHLNGPLADSPDEGYVGDSGHDGNGNSEWQSANKLKQGASSGSACGGGGSALRSEKRSKTEIKKQLRFEDDVLL